MSIVGFGDFLMHLSPHDNDRFLQSSAMDITFTGAEANVCAALGFWKEDVRFVTKLPEHNLALKGIMFLNSLNIDTKYIPFGSGRMGLYFLEKGHSVRPSTIIYDRLGTVFTSSKFEDYNFEEILKDANAFYLSGITPCLSDSLFDCCKKALKLAREKNIPVFYDVNLRPSLCDVTKAKTIFNALSPYITHLISNEEHLKQLLDFVPTKTENVDRLLELSKFALKKTNINNIAVTVRKTHSAHQTSFYASYFNGKDIALSKTYDLDVVDRVGSGDAFSAGMVYSFVNNLDISESVEFSSASCALKHTINSDINFSTTNEIMSLMNSSSNDVRR